ncbi:hypothetical protein KCU77_g2564, partial [Aureobasidium melanogenum]
MPFADFSQSRRSGLLALLRCIEGGDRDELDYINFEVLSDTRNASVPIYDLSCSVAVMGLCHDDWMQAETGRLVVAYAYVLQRAAAAILNPNAIANIDEELRGLILSRLNVKQEASAPSTGLMKVFAKPQGAILAIPGMYSGPIGDVTQMRRQYRRLGYAHMIDEFDTYPERVMDHAPLRQAWEARARDLIRQGLIGDRLVNVDTFCSEFSPYYIVRPGGTLSSVVAEADADVPQHSGTNIVSNSSTTTNNQQNASATEEGEQQTQTTDNADAFERKRAKNRKKNQNRKANKKAQKAEQQEEEAAEAHLADRLAENYTLKSSDTVVDDSGLIEGVNAWTIQTWIRKSDGKEASEEGDEKK